MLQTRNGKRTAAAALKVAVDLVDEGMIDEKEAVCRVEPKQLDALLHPTFDPEALKKAQVIGKGLAASPGAACGKVVFTAEDAKEWHARGEKVVLVRLETSPEDIEGMQVSEGILTVRGGMTSHAAVVARGMGTCCVSGCGDIVVDYENKKFTLAGKEYHEGDWISLDGSTGSIYGEAIATVPADPGSGYFGRLMGWADKYRQLKVYTNADTPRDAKQGRAFGAQGIGLCRTEHMFFEETRIKAMREMIVADNTEDRKKALAKIMPYQQGDFEGLYEAMEGCPVVIRFLDPPLHEFLPTKEEDIKEIAGEMGITVERLHEVIASLHEFNPMMGHRGCRLAVSYPEIAEMQTTAVINAAINVQKKHPDWTMVPEIMIPLVGEVKELKYVKDVVTATADKIIKDAGIDMKYEVGTMIEIPRARRDRHRGRVLLLRHQRPDPDDLRLLPRRRRQVPELLLRQEDLRVRPLRPPGSEGCWQAGEDGRRHGPRHPSQHPPGHLRRARRRPHLRGVLPQGGPGLCVLLPLPCAHRPSGRCSGRHQEPPVTPLQIHNRGRLLCSRPLFAI